MIIIKNKMVEITICSVVSRSDLRYISPDCPSSERSRTLSELLDLSSAIGFDASIDKSDPDAWVATLFGSIDFSPVVKSAGSCGSFDIDFSEPRLAPPERRHVHQDEYPVGCCSFACTISVAGAILCTCISCSMASCKENTRTLAISKKKHFKINLINNDNERHKHITEYLHCSTASGTR